MTGEITLSGRVLPVGGIKEKVLAAKRLGIKEIILPRQNEKNVNEDLNDELRTGLTIHLVNTIDEVLLLALLPASRARQEAAKRQRRRITRTCSKPERRAPAHGSAIRASVRRLFARAITSTSARTSFRREVLALSLERVRRTRPDGARVRRAGARVLGGPRARPHPGVPATSCRTGEFDDRGARAARAAVVAGGRRGLPADDGRDASWPRALAAGGAVRAVCHIGGGFHHAFANHGEGFCLFNDVAVAIRVLLPRRRSHRAAAVDRSRRASRQRHGVHLRERPARVHLLDAPAAQLPGVQAARLARHRAPRRHGRRRVSRAADRRAAAGLRAPAGHRVLSGRRRSVSRTISSAGSGADAKPDCVSAIARCCTPAVRTDVPVVVCSPAATRGSSKTRSTSTARRLRKPLDVS